MTKAAKGGILLLAAGVALLLIQLDLIPGDYFLLILGALFCLAYALFGGRKEYGNIGFLIPGTILLAIGGYAALDSGLALGVLVPGSFFYGLGLSFLAVFLVHTFWFREEDHGKRFWPVYPAGGLILFAVLLTVFREGWHLPGELFNYLWIAALFVAGLWLLLFRRKKEE